MKVATAAQSTIARTFAVAEASVLLRAEGIRKSFGGQVVLDNINLELRRGEVVLLRGENGSGKTTLLNILTGNLEPDAGSICYLSDGPQRSYRFPRHWWQELNPFCQFTPEFVAAEGLGRTWQDLRLFSSQALRDNISLGAKGHLGENPLLALFSPGWCSRREGAINQQTDAVLASLGLAGRGNSSADMVSLGQAKRVAIARAVASGTSLLFLDEPLAGLDGRGLNAVIELVESLAKSQVAIVVVEHVSNHHHLNRLITTDWLLERGTLKRNGSLTASVSSPWYSDAKPHNQWAPVIANNRDYFIEESLTGGALLTRIRTKSGKVAVPKPMVEIRDLVVQRGSRVVIGSGPDGSVPGFNLTLNEGEVLILQAPNGWGKTTLFEAVTGLISTNRGRITMNGQAMERMPVWQRVRMGLRVVPSSHKSFQNLTVREVFEVCGRTSIPRIFKETLARLCSSLSAGEKQLLALNATVSGPVYMYDEPFAALDKENIYRACSLMTSEMKAGKSQLILVPG